MYLVLLGWWRIFQNMQFACYCFGLFSEALESRKFMPHLWDDKIWNKLFSKSSFLQFVHLRFLKLKPKLTGHTCPEEAELHLASPWVYRVQKVDYVFSIAIFQASCLLYQLLDAGRCVTVAVAQMHSRYDITGWQFHTDLGFFLGSVPVVQVSVPSTWTV